MPNVYRLGVEYKDTGSSTNPDDQFLRVLNIPGSGMRNMPGIRPFKFLNLRLPVHAYIVLVTHERSSNRAANPWEDTIDLHAGRIIYWGDAKRDPKRTIDDFLGNRALRAAFDLALADDRLAIPPILHFSKPRPGLVRFNGLCVFDRLELTWFEDHGSPVQNYRAHLTVLDTDEVEVDWVHRRVRAASRADLQGDGPTAWRNYQAGEIDRLQVWAPRIRSREAQPPDAGSGAAGVLGQLVSLSPSVFEGAVVSLFQQVDVVHQVSQTRLTADGGFDFEGAFQLPPPLECTPSTFEEK